MEKDAKSPLILILPCVLLAAVLFSAWAVSVVAIAFLVAWFLWRQYRRQDLKKTLNPDFYRLIKNNQGKISVSDLAQKTGISGHDIRWFLEAKAKEYGAQKIIYQESGVVYYFLTSGALGSMFNGSDPEIVIPEPAPVPQSPPTPMIQTELAKRFSVHPSTLRKRRNKANFAEWSQEKDPDNIPWRYDPRTRQFSPQL
ncbi:MAG: hypothetical protein VKJ86_10345 [Synechococcus sp.]|nr:hypothetical protein [Synechococcus sp.]